MADVTRERLPSLLAPFNGERPPAPAWFSEALAVTPERTTFDLDGAAIELLTWGTIGKPGLLFLHGNAAHADWWSHIAPFFATDYRCAAISWSGMGKSGWRETYSIPLFAREALAAIDIAGLAASGLPPVVIGHSFGSFPLLYMAAHHAQAMAAGILIDALSPRSRRGPPKVDAERDLPRYPSEAAALARFRFLPEQGSDLPAIVDFFARGSLRCEDDAWTWRFDPRIWSKFDRTGQDADLLTRARVPLGVIYGEKSVVVDAERVAAARAEIPDCRFTAAIPDAGHHIMADQPIALIACLRLALSALKVDTA